ncbi:macrolide transporter subunit MacA [Posidoniimonas polymericola]|uniref:Macrolide transporter subunit MacA n=1 Tax=Posidoniimonas polymericola TaxID=2528002 RepID=A0A5C5YAI5_9BACT|nr:HlyD family efflux transporter periplasmic adaptor subunit [Posidoniimonas polymericola]TWT72706.1 macrolide transporter subunit MacA [Posidoniimonas polymericola]
MNSILPTALPTPPRSARRGVSVLVLLVLLAIVSGGAYATYQYLPAFQSRSLHDEIMFYEIERQDFSLAITERGEIESVGDAEIRSEVKTQNAGGLAILRLAPEGGLVQEGDFLVELDSSALREERTTQQISVNTAEALVVEARNLYETAVIAEQEYLEGVYVQERQTIESEVFVAEENLTRAQEYLQYSKKLAAKGYVNDLQLEADAFAVEKARKELEAAKTKLRVLDDFTKAKMLKQLQSDILITKAKWEAEKNSLQLESDKLTDINDQITKCVITAPRDGVVKYAHVSDRRGDNDFIVEEGAEVRERQTIIRLPDTSQMRVELTINESLVQHVKVGMPAQIRPIGVDDTVLPGRVSTINQYAEPSGWRKANVKEYKAYVELVSAADGLRPGMTASVTINSIDSPNVLQAPVQAVYSHGADFYCFVPRGEQLEARKLTCGPTNDRFFVIEDGLQEGERVAMNPRDLLSLVDLPELPKKPGRRGPEQRAPEPAPDAAKGEVAAARPQPAATDG